MSFSKKLARFALSGALAMSMVLPNSLAVFQAKVNADSLYLRQSPGGAVITTLSKGTTVAVLNNSSSWYKVSVNGKEGYVSGEYLTGTTATDVALGTGTVKCSSSVNFRSAPNTSSTSKCSRRKQRLVQGYIQWQDRLYPSGLYHARKQLRRHRYRSVEHRYLYDRHRRHGKVLHQRKLPLGGKHLVHQLR